MSAQSTYSLEVLAKVVIYRSCNRRLCLRCGTLQLQMLCYAAQQCSVVLCIGTVVNQNRPLCNVGLVMKSHLEGILSMMMGAWLIFRETYTTILDAALLGPSNSKMIEWVDDVFFGYICSAKDMLGQATSILTSSVGAGIVAGHKQMLRMEAASQRMGVAGMQEISSDAFIASVTMIRNGINVFLYQFVLLPLYMLVAFQKTVVCTGSRRQLCAL